MMREQNRHLAGSSVNGALARAGMTVFSIGVVTLVFVIYLELLVLTIRILTGAASFFALIGIVGLGLVALSIPIAVVAWYRKSVQMDLIVARFLLVSGVQGALLFLSEVFGRLLLESVASDYAADMLTFWNHFALVAGLLGGVGGVVAGCWAMRRYRRSLDFLRHSTR